MPAQPADEQGTRGEVIKDSQDNQLGLHGPMGLTRDPSVIWVDAEEEPDAEDQACSRPPVITALPRRGDHPPVNIYDESEVHGLPPEEFTSLCCGTLDMDMDALGNNLRTSHWTIEIPHRFL